MSLMGEGGYMANRVFKLDTFQQLYFDSEQIPKLPQDSI